MFGECRTCLSKDAHIADLRAQVESLSKLVYPKNDASSIPILSQELDHILSGSDQMVDIPADSLTDEESMILSGEYSNENN